MIHSRSETVTSRSPKSSWIAGRATFTTVVSSMIMNTPIATDARVNHLRLSGV